MDLEFGKTPFLHVNLVSLLTVTRQFDTTQSDSGFLTQSLKH